MLNILQIRLDSPLHRGPHTGFRMGIEMEYKGPSLVLGYSDMPHHFNLLKFVYFGGSYPGNCHCCGSSASFLLLIFHHCQFLFT